MALSSKEAAGFERYIMIDTFNVFLDQKESRSERGLHSVSFTDIVPS